MIKRTFVLFFCAVSFASFAQAQKSETASYGYIPEMKISVLSPLSLLDIKPFLEASVEKRFLERNALEVAMGVYLPNGFSDNSDFDNQTNTKREGVRIRVNWKWYEKQFKAKPNYNSYIAPELLFNYHNVYSAAWYDRFDDAYQEKLTTTRRNVSVGLGFKIGEQYYTKNHKFYIDQFFGCGLRVQKFSHSNIPEDISLTSSFLERNDGIYYLPYLILGIKLGIVLKK